MTPHSSNYCYDTFSDCDQILAWGMCHRYETDCCISCGGVLEDKEVTSTTEEVTSSTVEVTSTSTTEEVTSTTDCQDSSDDCQYIFSAGLCDEIPNRHCHQTCGKC